MQKRKIFLASSQEQFDTRIVKVLKELLSGPGHDVRSWDDLALPGEHVLDALERAAKNFDAAVFIFGADDIIFSRKDLSSATRDNVILEYGLFLGGLERRRVFILRQRGVHVPSDLSGIQRIEYNVQSVDLKSDLESCADKICRALDELGPRDETSIDYFGIPEALKEYQKVASMVRDFLASRAWNPQRTSGVPVHFDSYAAALEVYRQGLERVEERFLATSFVTSRFWVEQDIAFDLNHELLRRARRQGYSISMRRLLLLESDPRVEIENFGKNVRMLYRSSRDSDIDELWSKLQLAKNRHLSLGDAGCETRVARIDSSHKRFRVGSQSFDLDDQELAIYDSFRLDFFGGGSSGQIVDVTMFLPGIEGFEAALRQAVQVFEDLWRGGVPVGGYFRDLQREYDLSMRRIDHEKNWIYDYNRNLPKEDERLKKREMEEALGIVKAFKRDQNIKRHLDIGTCTGRYALELRDCVDLDGRIVGIDIDPKCIEYITNEYEVLLDEDDRFRFSVRDFLSEDFYASDKFDLITCMMGTISYFGYGSTDHGVGDVLVGALRKMYSFLSPGGLLVLSVWSQAAMESKDLINIYTKPDKKRLASWTPRAKVLIEELELAGFKTKRSPISRLEIIACFKPMEGHVRLS